MLDVFFRQDAGKVGTVLHRVGLALHQVHQRRLYVQVHPAPVGNGRQKQVLPLPGEGLVEC